MPYKSTLLEYWKNFKIFFLKIFDWSTVFDVRLQCSLLSNMVPVRRVWTDSSLNCTNYVHRHCNERIFKQYFHLLAIMHHCALQGYNDLTLCSFMTQIITICETKHKRCLITFIIAIWRQVTSRDQSLSIVVTFVQGGWTMILTKDTIGQLLQWKHTRP